MGHDVVVLVLLTAKNIRHVVYSTLVLLCLFLLRLEGHDLGDLVLHLHDSIHHCQFSRVSLFLMGCQAQFHQLQLFLQ